MTRGVRVGAQHRVERQEGLRGGRSAVRHNEAVQPTLRACAYGSRTQSVDRLTPFIQYRLRMV